jgi:Mg2+ and Co2+ transporter CorA
LTANLTWAALGAIMNTTKPLSLDEIEISSEVDVRRNIRERDQVERGDLKASAEELAALMRRLSDASMREIDQLMNQLQKLRTQLRTTGDRIQKDIAEYAELSQQTMQLTSIIVDSVTKLPRGRYQ